MRLRKLIATFGKLRGAELHFEDGFNLVTGENESGKSTWQAFIRAMLYGVSTSERSKGAFLADKEKFVPWTGEPPYGELELEASGRPVKITRAQGKGGFFQGVEAVYLDDGSPIQDKTRLGELLLGISREVFLRTAFIAEEDMLVSDSDGSLTKKIISLSSSGDEDISYNDALGRLEKQKRELFLNKNKGVIPQLEREISELELAAEQIRHAMSGQMENQKEIERLEEQLENLKNRENALKYRDAYQIIKKIEAAREEVQNATDALHKEKEILPKKPSRLPIVLGGSLALALGVGLSFLNLWAGLGAAAVILAIGAFIQGKQKAIDNSENIKAAEARLDTAYAKLGGLTEGRDVLELIELSKRFDPKLDQGDTQTLQRELGAKSQRLQSLTMEEQMRKGRLSQMGDLPEMDNLIILKKVELTEAKQQYNRIEIAIQILGSADGELRARFSPKIEKRTSEIFAYLNGGSFGQVKIKSLEPEIEVKKDQGEQPRSVLSLSNGTVDQLYFAMRLAVYEEIFKENPIPLILDNPFVAFDDERCHRALELLYELSKKTQVILFSCHKRESEYLGQRVKEVLL